MSAELYLCLDIGGSKTAVSVLAGNGNEHHREVFASRASEGFEAMYARLCAAIRRALEGHAPARIGVSIGGPLDAERGIVFSPPHLPGWDAVPLAALLEEQFGLPVRLEHDAKAGALAEWRYGAGRGSRNLVFLTLGTGLGAGLIVDGRLVRGSLGAAGEVGHWRMARDGPHLYGKRGSWEGYSSGAGLAALAHHLFPHLFGEALTAEDINAAARRGQPEAKEVLTVAGRTLGAGLALLVDLLAPEMIVLGALARRLEPVYLESALDTLRAEALPASLSRCPVRHAELGERLGDLAALCAALPPDAVPA